MENLSPLDQPLDLEETELEYDDASTGLRFANFLIDQIAVTVLLTIVLLWLYQTGMEEDNLGTLGAQLINIVVLLLYYLIMESTTGRTLGKYITGTKVVTYYNEKPTFENIAGRTLCRIIPFEPFSFLSGDRGWHDSISKTKVVKVKRV